MLERAETFQEMRGGLESGLLAGRRGLDRRGVREAEWLDGWADGFELIYSESGFAERTTARLCDRSPRYAWAVR